MPDRVKQQLKRRKVRDRSMVLLIVGTILLLPPIARIARVDTGLDELPLPLLYVFSIWLALIVGAALLARPLLDADEATGSWPDQTRASD